VDATVRRFFLEEDAEDGYTIPHMKNLIDGFDAARREQVMSLYADIYSGIGYRGKQGDPTLAWLLMTGLVRRGGNGQLEVRNRIFGQYSTMAGSVGSYLAGQCYLPRSLLQVRPRQSWCREGRSGTQA
jgi:hypothetical protein